MIEQRRLFLELTTAAGLSESDAAMVIAQSQVKELKRKEFLLQPGMQSKHMRFIEHGAMRSYYIDEEGHQHTLQLGIEGWWINDLYSYLTEKPTRMFIQATESTVVTLLPKSLLEDQLLRCPTLSHYFLKKFQKAYVALQERTLDHLGTEAMDRYTQFRQTYPELEQRFPQYIIASYLGITPEFLSQLRSKYRN
ncbi:MAG: Crp/Fnr family transcriptional regulator [Bacteroidetes bacterium]|nr:MAG: Crp/Fnr family transcriptional regulator [Bacteroidota bacterium]